MKIEVEVNVNAPDLKYLAEALLNGSSVFKPSVVEKVGTSSDEVKTSEPEVKTAEEPAPVVAQDEPAADPSPYTKEDVRNALTTLGQTQGKEKAKAVLTAVGATKFSDLTEEQYGEVIARVKELM